VTYHEHVPITLRVCNSHMVYTTGILAVHMGNQLFWTCKDGDLGSDSQLFNQFFAISTDNSRIITGMLIQMLHAANINDYVTGSTISICSF